MKPNIIFLILLTIIIISLLWCWITDFKKWLQNLFDKTEENKL